MTSSWYSLLVLSCLVAFTTAATRPAAPTKEVTDESLDTEGVSTNEREKKLFPIVQIVTFDNGPCQSTGGHDGTCYSSAECANLKGTAVGTCANGYGTCCVVEQSCNSVITTNNTYFVNPNYPSAYSTAGMCMATINPPAGTCQILLTFEHHETLGPTNGDCNNDTFTFTGGDPGVNIPTLCGCNTGQHYYVDVDNSSPPYKLLQTIASIAAARKWKIKVTFIKRDDPGKAPQRCLQYHRGTSGTLSSFNHCSTATAQMINNQKYSICFACVLGYCDVGVTLSNFDLGSTSGTCGGDYLAGGPTKYCGDHASLAIQVNATGPLVMTVCSDGDNDEMESGFSGSYSMMKC